MSASKSRASAPARIPSGSFTVDSSGEILVGTLRAEWLRKFGPPIARAVLRAFSTAEDAGFPLTDLVVQYSGLKVTARNLRGGALVFLMPLQKKSTQ